MMAKYVYVFGADATEGSAEMRDLLGGKGANLADMARLGIPVPPGFTITTEVCAYYYAHGRQYPPELASQVEAALGVVEKATGRRFGDPENPLLVSIRSGARRSMPGMMETVLNVGLTEQTLRGLIAQTGNERFAYDAYRRLVMMYSDVVMEKGAGIEPAEGKGIRRILDARLAALKARRGYGSDLELTASDLKALVARFKKTVRERLGQPFPEDPWDQLWGAIGAVF
ncbi:MAG: PEP/pyruvate-binding domain-containing protein, partial [Candidatus Bipolaricaulis anaerobius]|nr:PEP/pyruvate-binding domain-containing protein [Candidatus Bipolaricaulis anaerobius]